MPDPFCATKTKLFERVTAFSPVLVVGKDIFLIWIDSQMEYRETRRGHSFKNRGVAG